MRIGFGDFELNTATHELRHDGDEVAVEPQVFKLLQYLVEHADRVVTKEELLDNIWGDRFVSESALSSRIRDARRAVGDTGTAQRVIKTVHGTGYRFVAPAVRAADPGSTSDPSDIRRSPASVPISFTPMIGRADDVSAVVDLVRTNRLVTLTGAGGVGKSRLAAEVARRLESEFPDGVWWIELAPVAEPGAVPAAVAGALGVATQGQHRILDDLGSAVSRLRGLVVLDNCEHVIHATADLVRVLLSQAEGIHVLATSREDIRLPGEQVRMVAPLGTTDGHRSDAVELFKQRAEAATGLPADDDLDVIADICTSLDGIALAIELAAARMVSMTPQLLRDRLADRFTILTGTRNEVDRHQTLRQAVAWSYDLLSPEERLVMQHCVVFADGCDLAAVQAVCDEAFDEMTTMDLLDSLVHKSLLTVERIDGHIRFDMLETIRQFALQELDDGAKLDEVRRRHAAHFAAQAVERYDQWRGPEQQAALDWFIAEIANLRIAFRSAAETGDIETAGRIAAHGAMLGWLSMRYEPLDWVEELIETALADRPPVLPRLLIAGMLSVFRGGAAEANAYDKALTELQDDPSLDRFELDVSVTLRGLVQSFNGRPERLIEMMEQHRDDPEADYTALAGLLWTLPTVGRHGEAQQLAEPTIGAAQRVGTPMWIAWAMAGRGRAYGQTDPDVALEAIRAASAYAVEHRLLFYEALNARESAEIEALHGDFDQGLEMYETTLQELHRAGAAAHLAIAIASVAAFFTRFDHVDAAATLIGAAVANAGTVDMTVDIEGTVDLLVERLGRERYDELSDAGSTMNLAAAVHFAINHIAGLRDFVPD